MNQERTGGRPEGIENPPLNSHSPSDHIEDPGPLYDPTKRPTKEVVGPLPQEWSSNTEEVAATLSRDTLLDELSALIRIEPDFPHPRMHRFTEEEAEQFKAWTAPLSATDLLQEIQTRRAERRHQAQASRRGQRLRGPVLP